MTDETPVPTMKGTEAEILTALRERHRPGINPLAVSIAIRHVREGHRVVELEGERFEVVDPEWSIVQDVYGCEHGRDCTDVTPANRAGFEAIIAARVQAEG